MKIENRPASNCPRIAYLALLALLATSSPASAAEAKNAILFIGDGMGTTQVTAARIYKGNARDGRLTLDGLENLAHARTYSSNSMVTDSAAAGTAMATGVKVPSGTISVETVRVNGKREIRDIPTILELARAAGKSVGVVTTTRVTHATPACFYGHVRLRTFETPLAEQLLEVRLEVAMGGGRREFLPRDTPDPENGGEGNRTDGRDLLKEAVDSGFEVVLRQSEFDALEKRIDAGEKAGPVLALFESSDMSYEIDRAGDKWGEPSLAEMTRLAMKILSRNPNGYFLMVEGGRIDHACHGNQALRAVTDTVAFDDAVAAAIATAGDADDTLLVITADHETGGLAINGYYDIEIKGSELMTKSLRSGASDILSFSSGPGATEHDPDADHAASGYRQPALFAASSAYHTGVDVPVWGWGPGSQRVRGTMDNTDIPRLIASALGIEMK